MLCDILKDVPGSPSGRPDYKAGQVVELPDDLVEVARAEGWARPHVEIENKAIISDGKRRK